MTKVVNISTGRQRLLPTVQFTTLIKEKLTHVSTSTAVNKGFIVLKLSITVYLSLCFSPFQHRCGGKSQGKI